MTDFETSQSQPCGAPESAATEAEPAAPRRTFSVALRDARHMFGENDGGENYVVTADPMTRKVDGGERISMGFPLLALTDWTGNGEGIAHLIARLLTEHYAKVEA